MKVWLVHRDDDGTPETQLFTTKEKALERIRNYHNYDDESLKFFTGADLEYYYDDFGLTLMLVEIE